MYRGDNWLLVRRWQELIDIREEVDIVQIVSWNGEHFLFCSLNHDRKSHRIEQIMANHITSAQLKEYNQTRKHGLTALNILLGYISAATLHMCSKTYAGGWQETQLRLMLKKIVFTCGLDHILVTPKPTQIKLAGQRTGSLWVKLTISIVLHRTNFGGRMDLSLRNTTPVKTEDVFWAVILARAPAYSLLRSGNIEGKDLHLTSVSVIFGLKRDFSQSKRACRTFLAFLSSPAKLRYAHYAHPG